MTKHIEKPDTIHGRLMESFYYSGHSFERACKEFEWLLENDRWKEVGGYKHWTDRLVFVFPRKIHFGIDKPDGVFERPLRASTAQGPRITLARSDMVNEGRKITFEMELLKNKNKITWEIIDKCFDYGKRLGLGQWTGSGGYGRFNFVVV